MLQTVNSWTSLTNGLESVFVFCIQGLQEMHVLLREHLQVSKTITEG